jgi:zinc protease
MAHYLEHMLFKGTQRRAVGEIASTVENCGGDINAYTTFDRTVYYLTLASKHADTGMDLLADAIFNSSFDPSEFAREREVILEEIRRGMDDPGGKVGRQVFELAYEGSEVGRPIIGSEDSVRSFTRDGIVAFHDRWYRPGNMAVVVVGDFDAEHMREIARKTFGSAPARPLPSEKPRLPSMESPRHGKQIKILQGDYKQPRLELVFPAPPLEHFDTAALDLAAFALGSGDMARLNRKLRDEMGLITGSGASVFSPAFPGIFEVSLFGPVETWLAAAEATAREIASLCAHEGVTAAEIDRARASLRSDRIYRDETVDGQARSLGFGLTTSHKQLFDDVYWTTVSGINEVSVYRACQRWLLPENMIAVGMLPEGTPITEAELGEALRRGFAAGARADAKPPVLARSSRTKGADDAEVIELSESVKLIYRQNPDAKLFSLVAASEGGLRAETSETTGIYNAAAGLVARAAKSWSYDRLVSTVEGMGASLDGFSGKDSFGLQFHCLTDQLPELADIFGAVLREPVFPEEQWESLRREILEGLRNQDDSPAGVCVRKFQELIFGEHPYRWSLLGRRENVESWSTQDLLQHFEVARDSGPWMIGAVGAHKPEVLARELEKVLKGWSPVKSKRVFVSSSHVQKPKSQELKIEKNREQTHICYGFPGLSWEDPSRVTLDVLTTVLGGHGGRLFLRLRDRDGLAYTVSPVVSHGKHPGAVGSYIACSPDKAVQARQSLEREMLHLCESEVSPSELERAINYIVGSHEMDLQRADSQSMTMALMELYGIGHDDFRTYPRRVEAVTSRQILEAARRLFDKSHAVGVMVGPR